MNDIAIKITGLKKEYRLGRFCGSTLKEDLQRRIAIIRGKEDPANKIGENRIDGKRFMALNGIDLEIKQGETVGIIGANGAGKSTLLKLLCQITAPTQGQIEIYGRITSMLEVGTGFNGELTGRENIYQNGSILGMKKKEIDLLIEDIIDYSEVREFIDTPVKRYSSGMYIKLGFAIASHLNSEIVIMDEVLAVGDIDFQHKCLKQMKMLAQEEKRTVLYVSHNMNTIRELCNRVVVLDEGKIIYDGNTEYGIFRYCNLKNIQQKYHFDLANISTDRKNPSKTDCKILSLNLHKTDSIEYQQGQPLNFSIKVLSRKNINNLGLLLTVTALGTSVGTVPFISLKPMSINEEKVFNISVDTSIFAEGTYDMTVSLVQKVQNKIESFDIIVDVFSFIISPLLDIAWNRSVFGAVILSAQVKENA